MITLNNFANYTLQIKAMTDLAVIQGKAEALSDNLEKEKDNLEKTLNEMFLDGEAIKKDNSYYTYSHGEHHVEDIELTDEAEAISDRICCIDEELLKIQDLICV